MNEKRFLFVVKMIVLALEQFIPPTGSNDRIRKYSRRSIIDLALNCGASESITSEEIEQVLDQSWGEILNPLKRDFNTEGRDGSM